MATHMASHQEPQVSILLPIFNAERYLEKALQSLLDQSFQDFEIVAIDDGSTDGSIAVLEGFSDTRIRIEKNSRNLGLIATLNRGIPLCQGEFIARMDADDIALPTRIEKQILHMRKYPTCILVGTNRSAIDEYDRPVPSFHLPPTGSPLIRWKLLTGNFISHASVMFRKSALPLPLFDERYKHAEDYAAWLKLSLLGDIDMLTERLFKVRFHPQSVSQQNRMAQLKSAMDALADHLRSQYGTEFEFNSLALWSAPQFAATFTKPADFFALLRWMNPLRKPFRRDLGRFVLWKAFGHYHRRLLLLVISHRKRLDLLFPILLAMTVSLFPKSS